MESILKEALIQILDSITIIEESLQGIGFDSYRTNRKIKIEVVQQFESIMSVVLNLPESIKEKYPELPWYLVYVTKVQFVDPQNGIKDEEVWNTAKKDLKKLRKTIQGFISTKMEAECK